ncbi:hypothetical protein ACFQU5_04965 [Ureibacillus sp. GCM10028918]
MVRRIIKEIQEEHIYPKIHLGKANAVRTEALQELLVKLQSHEIDDIKEE